MIRVLLWKTENFQNANGQTDIGARIDHRMKIDKIVAGSKEAGYFIQSGWGFDGYETDFLYWLDFETDEDAIEFKLKYL